MVTEVLGVRASTWEYEEDPIQPTTPSWESEQETESDFHPPCASFLCAGPGVGLGAALNARAPNVGSGAREAGTGAGLAAWQERPDPVPGTGEGVWLAGQAISVNLCCWHTGQHRAHSCVWYSAWPQKFPVSAAWFGARPWLLGLKIWFPSPRYASPSCPVGFLASSLSAENSYSRILLLATEDSNTQGETFHFRGRPLSDFK